MAHNRIIEATWDPETHTSTVVKSSQYGTFTRSVVCDEQDFDIENRWDGCNIAESKCDRAIQETKVKDMYSRWKEAGHIYYVLCGQSDSKYTQDCDFAKDLYRMVINARNQYYSEKKKLELMNKSIGSNVHWLAEQRRKWRSATQDKE